MSGESTERETVTVSLPAEVDDWLTERSRELDLDREAVVTQLLASYHAAARLDGGNGSLEEIEAIGVPVAEAESIEERVDETLERTVEGTVERKVEQAVETRVQAAIESVHDDLSERIEEVASDGQEKLEDVRERVVQLKREIDEKAPAEHDHEQFERIDELEDHLAEIEESLEELTERHDETDDRLETVAWVVSDLREAYESQESVETVDRIKRAAAKEDIDRANCENCGNGVSVALLTDPECPHCQATVTNVEPAASFFGKPTLLTASQLESKG